MRFRTVIGIDASEGLLRFARLSRRRFGWVSRSWHLRLPTDPEESRRMVARFVDANGLSTPPAVIGLDGSEAFLTILAGARRDRPAWQAALREHLNDLRAIAGSETVQDRHRLPDAQGQRRVLLGIARQDALAGLLAPLLGAGVRIAGVSPVSLAFYNLAAARATLRGQDLTILCPIADGGTEVLRGQGGALDRLWRLPPGLDQPAQAEAAISALCEGFGERSRGAPPLICWCGETELPEAVASRIARETGARLASITPWLPPPETPGSEQAPRAIALAFQLLRDAAPALSLLPSPAREKALLHRQLPAWAGVAALAALTAAGLAVQADRASRDAARRLTLATAHWERLQDVLEQEQETAAQNAVLERQARELRATVTSPLLAHSLLHTLARARHPDDWIVRVSDAPSYGAEGWSSPRRTPAGSDITGPDVPGFVFERHTVIVEGYTPAADLSTVRALIDALRNHPKVRSVDLLGDDSVVLIPEHEHRVLTLEGRRFVLEVRLHDA